LPIIPEKYRERIEKFITGVIKNYNCKLYAIYANPEHVHFLVSRAPNISEEYLAEIIADSSKNLIGKIQLPHSLFQKEILILY
jgi:REP element-mobilizing transposase RayT